MLPLFVLRRLRRSHHSASLFLRPFSANSPLLQLQLSLSLPTYFIWGSNTSVGKTLVSAGLASSSLLSSRSVLSDFFYLKPIQTGFPSDSDSRFVFNKVHSIFLHRKPSLSLMASQHVLKASVSAAKSVLGSEITEDCQFGMCDLGYYEERRVVREETDVASRLVCQTIYAWKEPISPHLAAEREGGLLQDSLVLETLQKCLNDWLGGKEERQKTGALCIVETAGGVASPGPSGSLQCDLYRPFRLPGVLVGDGKLGGISGTISAYELLRLRGYDVVAIIFIDHGLNNEAPLLSYLRNRVPVLVLPSIPDDQSDDLIEWFDESLNVFDSLKETMLSAHSERIARLHNMPKKAREIFWWPFTQHKLVSEDDVTVIDSRCGENFAVFKANEYLTQQFDACASWWTQGLNATLQTELARDMGYAAGRFGHVMFPENVYEPALETAELLLEGVGKGWASRTYFSDNGSTAIEIALKMAFRKFSFDHGIHSGSLQDGTSEKQVELMVIALKGSYHGDTLGAMEAQAPSCYTGFLQQPWHTGRGLFLDPPTVYMCKGSWNLSLPVGLQMDTKLNKISFTSRDEIFNLNRDHSDLARTYSGYLSQLLSQQSNSKRLLGALIIEPVILAAGGMHMVDPLFQRILVKECQIRSIPVIFDEVFTGFWRLGTETASKLLHCLPDIACYAKLMTGGIIPLAATLATKSVYESFIGDSKLHALLHGHSYSAHAMGCTAAARSIKMFKDPQTNDNINGDKSSLKELWNERLVHQISIHPGIKRMVVIGTLCALELKAEGCDSGYASSYSISLVRKLREDGVYTRPLGNVIYLMCGPFTSPEICTQALTKLYRRLEEFNQSEDARISRMEIKQN